MSDEGEDLRAYNVPHDGDGLYSVTPLYSLLSRSMSVLTGCLADRFREAAAGKSNKQRFSQLHPV